MFGLDKGWHICLSYIVHAMDLLPCACRRVESISHLLLKPCSSLHDSLELTLCVHCVIVFIDCNLFARSKIWICFPGQIVWILHLTWWPSSWSFVLHRSCERILVVRLMGRCLVGETAGNSFILCHLGVKSWILFLRSLFVHYEWVFVGQFLIIIINLNLAISSNLTHGVCKGAGYAKIEFADFDVIVACKSDWEGATHLY